MTGSRAQPGDRDARPARPPAARPRHDPAEINPVARLADGSFVALDAHLEMEDEAVGRHKKVLAGDRRRPHEPRETTSPREFERNVKAIDAADHRGVIQGKDHGFTGNLGLVIGAGGGSLTLTDAVRRRAASPPTTPRSAATPRSRSRRASRWRS